MVTRSIQQGAHHMKALADLFSTDYGLFSIAGLLFIVFMAFWFYRFFTQKMEQAEQEQRAKN
jgi:cytochrome bd-type quinol oxidase subunit 2